MDAELKAYLDERFNALDKRLADLDRRIDGAHDGFVSIHARFDAMSMRNEQFAPRVIGELAHIRQELLLINRTSVETLRERLNRVESGLLKLHVRIDDFAATYTAR